MVSRISLVFNKSIDHYIFDDVVQMDFPKIARRPVINPGMEVFIANKFGEYSHNGNCNLVELDNLINDKER